LGDAALGEARQTDSMADNNQPIEWYLAREGQQHGPVTDAELKKIIELGYLRPTDLVWRQGMAEWAVAESVLDLRPTAAAPPPPSPSPRPAAPVGRQADGATVDAARRYTQPTASSGENSGAPQSHPRPSADVAGRDPGRGAYAPSAQPAPATDAAAAQRAGYADRAHTGTAQATRDAATPRSGAETPPRAFPWRLAAALGLVSIVAAGGLALYRTGAFADLPFLAAPVTTDDVPVISRPNDSAREASASTSPSDGSHLPQPLEQRLQSSPLWKVLRAKFPDWYAERVAEIAKLSADSKSEREIDSALTRSVVELRRRNQTEALASSPERLKAMASSFVESLNRLSRISTSACYGYISQGEASPAVSDLTSPEHRMTIDAQLATIFEAAADGRKSPAPREAPKREDYDVLSNELAQRGWSAADLQLFTDARALSRAAPEKVCQMVQDWFAAQLAVADEGVKLRLLSEALKPVVAG